MSAAPKFTPGPWSCGNAERLSSEMAYSKDSTGFQPLGGCGCCGSPWVNGATDEECKANARLIAAAPDLYAAAQAAAAVLARVGSHPDFDVVTAHGALTAALAKVQP